MADYPDYLGSILPGTLYYMDTTHGSRSPNQNIENLYANMDSSDRNQETFCPTKIRKGPEDLISPQTIINNLDFYLPLSLPVLTTMAEDPRSHNHCPSLYKRGKNNFAN